jgi:hypothetical protein
LFIVAELPSEYGGFLLKNLLCFKSSDVIAIESQDENTGGVQLKSRA